MNEVTLREYIESKIRGAETQLRAEIEALARSVEKSERILSERLEGIPSQMATREHLRMTQERLEDRIAAQEDKISDLRGNLREQRAYAIGGAAVVAFLVSLFGLALRWFLV